MLEEKYSVVDFYSKMLGVELKKTYLVPVNVNPYDDQRRAGLRTGYDFYKDKDERSFKAFQYKYFNYVSFPNFDYNQDVDLADPNYIYCIKTKLKLEHCDYVDLSDAQILDFYYADPSKSNEKVEGIYQGSALRNEFWPLKKNAICVENLAPYDDAGIIVSSTEPIIIEVDFYHNPCRDHDYDFGRSPYKYHDINLKNGSIIYERDPETKVELNHLLKEENTHGEGLFGGSYNRFSHEKTYFSASRIAQFLKEPRGYLKNYLRFILNSE
jgi:hypothetical protein